MLSYRSWYLQVSNTLLLFQLLSCVQLFVTPWTAATQATLYFSISQSCSNSCPLSQWCYLIISTYASPFSFCLQSFPSSRSFPMNWLFASDGQSIGVSALASVLPVSIHGWFLLGLTGLSTLQSKGLSRVFSSPTVQKHQFFSFQPYL